MHLARRAYLLVFLAALLAIGATRDALVKRDAVAEWATQLASPVQVAFVEAPHLDAPLASRAVIGRFLDAQ